MSEMIEVVPDVYILWMYVIIFVSFWAGVFAERSTNGYREEQNG